jgi:dipeptidyl aminopeptidase/acylaminoacyl peptidase
VAFAESNLTTPLAIRIVEQGVDHLRYAASSPVPEQMRPASVIDVSTRNTAGEPVAAILMLPRSPRSVRPPLIVNIYPTQSIFRYFIDDGYGASQVFLDQGYAVLFATTRQPTAPTLVTQGEAYARRGVGPKGMKVLVDDLTSVLGEVQRRGLADIHRACGFGHSNGAAALVHFMAMSNALKCVVLSAPALRDADAYANDALAGKLVSGLIGGPEPWNDPDFYTGMDPLFIANRLKTPTLLFEGSRDSGLLQSVRLFGAMRSANGSIDLVVYPGQGHVPDAPTRADAIARALRFVDAHIFGGPMRPAPPEIR